MKNNIFKRAYNKLLKYRYYIIPIIIFIFLVYAAYEYYSKYFHILSDPRNIRNIIISYGKYSIFAFLILQIIQVIAFFIPGEIIQIAGGYIYGTLFGSILSLLGITLGSIIVYGISHCCGKPLIDKIVSKKNLSFFDKLLNMGSINYMVFLLYLIPGIPKDVLGYICGISDISFRNFVIYSTLGRLPGIFISTYFGAKISSENLVILIAIAVTMIILFAIGVIRGERIIRYLVKKGEPENNG